MRSHNSFEGKTVLSPRPQYVLTLAVIAAMYLSGSRASAGYVSIAELADDLDGIRTFPLLCEFEGSLGIANAHMGEERRRRADDSNDPLAPSLLLQHLLATVRNYSVDSGCGSPSPTSGSSPSAPLFGSLSQPSVPPLVPTGFLVFRMGDAHPFSIASFLFRPPRAA